MSKAAELAALIGSQTALSNRNLIINGAMQVAQRGTSFTSIAHNGYSLDRYIMQLSGLDGNVDVEQSTTVPEGFASSMKVSVDASNTTLDASDYLAVQTRLEGQDLQHLKKGTSNAESITFSFWVRSSVASTYTLQLKDNDNTRQIAATYTINSADTWEYKTITFAGDTTGAFDNDNALSLQVIFWIDAGTTFTSGTLDTSWATQTNANRVDDTTGWLISSTPTFYITGVQLEVGEQATPFEHRSFGDELRRCQRYYLISGASAGLSQSTTAVDFSIPFPQEMRADPTLGQQGVATITNVATADFAQSSTSISSVNIDQRGAHVRLLNFSGLTTAATYLWRNFNSNLLTFDSEL